MLPTTLRCGTGDKHHAKVTGDNALVVAVIPSNPKYIPFKVLNVQHWQNGFLRDSAGSADMTINGATTPTEFGVFSQNDRHIFVEKVTLTLHSSGMKLDSNEIRQFGAAGLLGNGIDLVYRFAGETFDLFGNDVKALSQFYRYSDSVEGVTDGISAGVDFVVVTKTFPRPLGIEAQTDDQLVINITDDLTGLTLFEAEYEGYHINLED